MKKQYLIILLTLFISCKRDADDKNLSPLNENDQSGLRLFGSDGAAILSGQGGNQKKWQILRLYKAFGSDKSTFSAMNINIIDKANQSDILENLSITLKSAIVEFKTSPVGLNGYGGVSDGTFEVKLPNGNVLLNRKGTFSVMGTFTPFYQTSFPGIFSNLKIIPSIYIESGKLNYNGKEYKGEFLQVVSNESNNLSVFKGTVLLLYLPE